MAQGRQSITIDSDELIQGITTSSNLNDGGISSDSCAVNLMSNPGVVYPTNGAVDLGALSTYQVIASCPDATGLYQKWILDTNGNLSYISYNGVLASISGGSASGTFLYGESDMVMYRGKIYATYASNMNQYTINYSLPSVTVTPAWFTVATFSPSAHPMLVFNKVLFIADMNNIHTYNGTTQTASVLTLDTYEQITAIAVDPGTGRMMVAVASSQGGIGASGDTIAEVLTQSYIGLWDGANPTQFLRKVPVDAVVTAFKNVGGRVQVVYGNNLGTWNGSGIDFVRDLRNNVAGLTSVTYKQQISNVGRMLLVTDNSANTNNPYLASPVYRILAVGEIQKGKSSTFPIVNQISAIHMVDNMWYGTSSNLGFIYAMLSASDNKEHIYFVPVYSHSTVLSTGDVSPLLVTKRVTFPRPSQVNLIRIFFEDTVAANGAIIGTLTAVDDTLNTMASQIVSNPSTSSATKWFDMPVDGLTTECQVVFHWTETTTNHGIQKIMIFFTPYE